MSTEHILEPQSYLDGESVEPVATPDADGEALDEGSFGQFEVELLSQADRRRRATDAEWDGGRAVLWEEGDDFCVRAVVVGDGAELAEALDGWADATGAELDRDGDEVTFTVCG